MSFVSPTQLEKIDYGQTMWDKIMNANSGKLETILTNFLTLWNSSTKNTGQCAKWNGTAWVVSDIEIPPPVSLTDSDPIATNAALGGVFTVTISGNRTFSNPTNVFSGKTYFWYIKQDSVGSRLGTFASNWVFSSTPVLSTSPNSVDLIKGVAIGSVLYCTLYKNFEVS